MSTLLSPHYFARLHALRERLARVLRGRAASRASATGRGTVPEFDSHRAYVPGDDVRDIDWNLYARLDRYYIKSMLREEEGQLRLLVDGSASLREPEPGKRERALETAGALGFLALGAGERVTVHSWSDRLLSAREFGGGEADVPAFLRHLTELPQGSGTSLARSLEDLIRVTPLGRSRLAVVSDFADGSGYGPPLELLARRGVRPSALQFLHPGEVRFAHRGNLILTDPETGATVRRLVGYRDLKDAQQAVERFLRRTEETLAPRCERFVRHLTDRPFEEAVLAWHLPRGTER